MVRGGECMQKMERSPLPISRLDRHPENQYISRQAPFFRHLTKINGGLVYLIVKCHKFTISWFRAVFGLCVLLGWSEPWSVRADLTTAFQGPTLDPNLQLDVPDANVGTITLDTANHDLLFQGPGADLWNGRNGLPFAWTSIPQVGVGGRWRAETEVQYFDTSR